MSARWRSIAWATVPCAATLYPRIMLLGGYPATDEGIFAFAAQQAHLSLAAGLGLPDFWPLMAYPLLVSWVYAFDLNHFLLLRLVDMVVALVVAALLYRVAAKESGSWVFGAIIAAIFTFTMNQHAFIQHGFKNSMFAAYIPLLWAAHIGLFGEQREGFRWWLCGVLVAIAVVLRETFVSFALFGAIAILVGHGMRSLLQYVAAGLIAGTLLIGALLLMRGGMTEVLASYAVAGQLYAALDHLRWTYLAAAFSTAFREASPALPWVLLGLAAIVFRFRREASDPPVGRWLFWLGAALVPLTEPVMKIGFPYQIAVSLLGFCGLAALGWRRLALAPHGVRLGVGIVATSLSLALAWPQSGRLNQFFRERTLNNIKAFGGQQWPERSVSQSNYLLLAAAIQKAASPAATLSTSGSMSALFPLTGLVPSSYRLHNLSETALALRSDPSALQQAIRDCPPDVIMLTSRTDIPAREVISRAIAGLGEYSQVAMVPVAADKDYGSFGGVVYLRSSPSTCKTVPSPRR